LNLQPLLFDPLRGRLQAELIGSGGRCSREPFDRALEDIMLMLFWLPMIILGGIWSIAVDAASKEAKRGHSPARRDDEAALGRRPHHDQ
jgi:hypothetical protein